jgi:hypothetical protein
MLAQQHGVVIFTNIAFHINMSSSSALALIAQPHLPALFSANELYMRPPLYLQPPKGSHQELSGRVIHFYC